ncbi:MAG: 6-carboxyhexanoate--CoA ligase [Thermodesulfovibrionales bacterium]
MSPAPGNKGSSIWSVRLRASRRGVHISGAEGLYGRDEVERAVGLYARRALGHPRGRPDTIAITVEEVRERPALIAALPVMTLACGSTRQARGVIRTLLGLSGVSEDAAREAMEVLYSGPVMRGAALVSARGGTRLEPDPSRGVRASRMGVSKDAMRGIGRGLSRLGINTETVREALVLASKVASCPGVLAEVCVSDDPGYTTGYVASRRLGYLRVPHIKRAGSRRGGRVIFLKEGADAGKAIRYLERRPVLVSSVGGFRGPAPLESLAGKP